MTEREYKIICKLIDLHSSSKPSINPLVEDTVLITKEHIEELKKDIKELLVDETLPTPTVVYQPNYISSPNEVVYPEKDIDWSYIPNIIKPEFTCNTDVDKTTIDKVISGKINLTKQ